MQIFVRFQALNLNFYKHILVIFTLRKCNYKTKMRLFSSLILSSAITFSILAQALKIDREINGSYYKLNDLEINLSSDQISIMRNNENIYSENISGKKVFKSSPGGNYFFIASFLFSNEKSDYPIDIKVFEKTGEMIFRYKLTAPFDLPHPLISVNDNGFLALFDPLKFSVDFIGKESNRKVELEKDVPFEMEKAAFMEMNDDYLFVLTSQTALDVTENSENVKLYKINLSGLEIDKIELDYNTPTLLKIIDENVFVSGVKFENYKPLGKTIKYDSQLHQIASNDRILEDIIGYENGFYAKYFNRIYYLRNDLSIVNEKQLDNSERISHIAVWNDKLLAATSKAGENNIFFFSNDLKVLYEENLKKLKIGRLNDMSISNSSLILYFDSKSAKMSINNQRK